MFLPEGVLDEEITLESIRADLGDLNDGLNNFIANEAQKVFAILSLSIDSPETIATAIRLIFERRDILDDKKLPVPRPPPEPEEGTEEDDADISYVLWDIDPEEKVFTRMRIENFYDRQWSVLSPVISNSPERYFNEHCTSQHIMPFTSYVDMQTQGAFSQIFKITIHPKHFEDALGNWVSLRLRKHNAHDINK